MIFTFLEAIGPAVLVGALFGLAIACNVQLSVQHARTLVLAVIAGTAWGVYHLGIPWSIEIYFQVIALAFANVIAGCVGAVIGYVAVLITNHA